MKYFKYQENKNLSSVWKVFEEMTEVPAEVMLSDKAIKFSHVLETFEACKNKNPEGLESFNYTGYEVKCSQNDDNNKYERIKKELHLKDYSSEEGTSGFEYGTYNSAIISDKGATNDYERFEDEEVYRSAIKRLKTLKEKYLEQQGLDVVVSLIYVMMNPDEPTKLTEIAKSFQEVGEIVKDILTSGKPTEQVICDLKEE